MRPNHAAPQLAKGKKRRMKLVLILLMVFIAWAVYTWYLQHGVLQEKHTMLEEGKKQAAILENKHKDLQFEVNRLHDKEYLAELARKYYFMSKPDEIIFVIPDQE